jgi:hypothetical protein
MCTTYTAHRILCWFVHHNNIWWRVQISQFDTALSNDVQTNVKKFGGRGWWFAIPPVGRAGTHVFCSSEAPHGLTGQGVCFSSGETEWAAVWTGRPEVSMPTRCGNLYLYVTVGVEYNHPIFQLSVWQVEEGLFACCVGFITWLALVRIVYHKLWLVYTSLQYEIT